LAARTTSASPSSRKRFERAVAGTGWLLIQPFHGPDDSTEMAKRRSKHADPATAEAREAEVVARGAGERQIRSRWELRRLLPQLRVPRPRDLLRALPGRDAPRG
jgi:hypothetical protein